MFSKKILGRDKSELIENDWKVYRSDMRDNSCSRKWKSEFTTIGEGCTSIEINLDGYENRNLAVTIKLSSFEHIDFFKNHIQNKLQIKPRQIHQSPSFPRELSFENMSLNSSSTIQLLEAINTANALVNPTKPTVLPMQPLIDELDFIIKRVNSSVEVIQERPVKSY